MKVNKSAGLEFAVLEKGETLKTTSLVSQLGTGPQASMLIDIVKATSIGWPTGETGRDGGPIFRMASAEEIVSRAEAIVSLTLDVMVRNGWSVPMVGADELVQTNGQAGFLDPDK